MNIPYKEYTYDRKGGNAEIEKHIRIGIVYAIRLCGIIKSCAEEMRPMKRLPVVNQHIYSGIDRPIREEKTLHGRYIGKKRQCK